MQVGISKDQIATFLAYIGAGAILVWALLKSVGIIQSPVWVEMIPYFGAGIALLSFVFKAGQLIQRINEMEKDIHELRQLKEDVYSIRQELSKMHQNINYLMGKTTTNKI